MLHRFVVLLGFAALTSCLPDPPPTPTDGPLDRNTLTGTGAFTFTPTGHLSDRPITVFYHIPDSAHQSSPIAMVVHGSARDGEYLRNALKPESDRRNAIILMPNFGSAEYSNNYFLLGNLFDDGENPSVASQNDSTEWTYAIIEQLFIHFRAEVASKDARYDLVGFSGGGQFAHRFALFAHRPQCDRIVACSSGWYTLPDAASPYPYGLGTTQRASDADVRKALATPLHLAVGSADTDPNSSGLRHTAEADAQGLNRFQRANYAFQRAMDQSTALNAPLAWSLHLESGVAHSAVGMGNYALTYLYP
jgi:pimeloyl-ACP methyl ester carboxylesterase